jgi:hypothetical protein
MIIGISTSLSPSPIPIPSPQSFQSGRTVRLGNGWNRSWTYADGSGSDGDVLHLEPQSPILTFRRGTRAFGAEARFG